MVVGPRKGGRMSSNGVIPRFSDTDQRVSLKSWVANE